LLDFVEELLGKRHGQMKHGNKPELKREI
jgi:hypothetical protein